jgi:hypothetical protein
VRALAQQQPRRRPLHDERQRGEVLDAVRDVERRGGVRGGALGVAAAVEERDDPLAVGGVADHLAAGNERELARCEVRVLRPHCSVCHENFSTVRAPALHWRTGALS